MRNLFAAAVAALIATGALATPSDAKTVVKPVGVHKVVKVNTVGTNHAVKVVKVVPRKAFARDIVCHRGYFRHHGRCVVMHRGHHY
jgi:uncharacterized membrane protein